MNSEQSPERLSATLPTYPFSALHGQSSLQLALLLIAVDPRIGGVLIEGARGTAKTTSARALAEILPEGAFVNLPLGASEEHLTGSLDLEVVLQQGKSCFKPGLLARAHKGVLYVDEINLLADMLVDLLLDVCSSGVNRVERDGVSHQHAADIVLVGTMNPEEGELRPQLLDRFGLFVNAETVMTIEMRQRIVRSRMAFDDDPVAFNLAYAAQQRQRIEQLSSARMNASRIAFTDSDHERVARKCHDANVDGVRADLVMLRASRAMAALAGRLHITPEDIDAVADMVLAHRRKGQAESAEDKPTRLKGDTPSPRTGSDFETGSEADGPDARHSGDTPESDEKAGTGKSAQAGSGAAPPAELPGSAVPGEARGPKPGSGSVPEQVPDASSSSGEDAHWGAMPGQAVPIRQVGWPDVSGGAPIGKKP